MQVEEKSVKSSGMSAAAGARSLAVTAAAVPHTASFQGVKRHRDDDERGSGCSHPVKAKKLKKSVVNTTLASSNNRWATVEGKKKYEGIHFKKQVVT